MKVGMPARRSMAPPFFLYGYLFVWLVDFVYFCRAKGKYVPEIVYLLKHNELQMKRILRLLLLLCIALQVVVSAAAHIRNYGINEGMPDNTANCLTQDNRGFVWIGTSNGLVRFDGMFFSVFRHDNLDAASLSNNNVHWLLPVEKGMYVAHDAGLDWYSYADGFFHRCTSAEQGVNGARIMSIKMIGKRVVVTTEHGDVLSVNGSNMERIHTGKRLYVVEPTPCGVFALGDGKAFLYTPDMRRLKATAPTDARWRRETMAYYSPREKRVFIGSGVGTKSYAYKLSPHALQQTAEPVPADLRAVTDCPHATAFATDGRGIMLRSHATEQWLTQSKDNICGDAVYSLLADQSGNLWIGTDGGPLMLTAEAIASGSSTFVQVKVPRNDGTNLADYLLSNVYITSICIDGAGRKWFGTSGNGVYLISADNLQQIEHFTTSNSALLSNIIESVSVNDRTGEVFFGTANGLCSYIGDATEPAEEMTKDSVYAYPNPVEPGYTGLITVVGLTLNADIKIVGPAGTLVKSGRSNGGTFTWDGTDLHGNPVASGIYMVETATADGKKGTVCKIGVIR